MTGRQLKAFAAQIPDDCVVELELGAVQKQFSQVFDHYRYRADEFIHWTPLPVAPLRVVIVPDVTQAARVAEKLDGGPKVEEL